MHIELKPIPEYEKHYLASAQGTIFSIKSNRFLKISKQSNKRYYCVILSKNGFTKTHRVHRLVAKAFLKTDKCFNELEVNHKDGNGLNNKIENLEWCSKRENSLHRCRVLKRGLPPLNFKGKFGKDHNRSKSFYILNIVSDEIIKYESGLEFFRKTGKDRTSISFARAILNKKNVDYFDFSKGRGLSGLRLVAPEYIKNNYPHYELV